MKNNTKGRFGSGKTRPVWETDGMISPDELMRDLGYEVEAGDVKASQHDRTTKIENKNERVIAIVFAKDISGSMNLALRQEVDSFNETMIPGLMGVEKVKRRTIRASVTTFAEKIRPIRPGLLTLSELKSAPLTVGELLALPNRGATSLYQAMISSIRFLERREKMMFARKELNHPMKKIVVISTDGANNMPPLYASAVLAERERVLSLIQGRNARDCWQFVLAYFDTDGGLTKSKFGQICKDTGFEGYFFDRCDSNMTPQQMFRHNFDFFSKNVTGRI